MPETKTTNENGHQWSWLGELRDFTGKEKCDFCGTKWIDYFLATQNGRIHVCLGNIDPAKQRIVDGIIITGPPS